MLIKTVLSISDSPGLLWTTQSHIKTYPDYVGPKCKTLRGYNNGSWIVWLLHFFCLFFCVQVTWLSRYRPWEQKTWRTFLSFLVQKSIFWVSFCIKISFDYISSEKYIFYFHNIHSVNVHNHSLGRCCEDFSDLARIMWNWYVLVAMDAAIA